MTPLLSITIPTWNREAYLKGALERITRQIAPFSDDIQLVVSNNASTDGTKALLDSFAADNPGIKLKVYHQDENTGYFGNFKKCRELADGKFVWLLSDDDYISEGVVAELMQVLKSNPDLGLVFLENWQGDSSTETLRHSATMNFSELLKLYAHRITLISSVIIRNNKEYDEFIYSTFDKNMFLGFIFLLYAVKDFPASVVLYGRGLNVSVAKYSFNVFVAWIDHMQAILQYVVQQNIITKEMREHFESSYLKIVVWDFYLKWKSGDKDKTLQYPDLEYVLKQTFSRNEVFQKMYSPFYPLPGAIIPAFWLIRKVFRKCRKIIRRVSK